METNAKNVRATRAHINELIRARLEWMEGDIPLNLIDPLSDYGMTLTTEVGNTTYTLVRCDGELALYRIAENGYPQTIASSLETPELVPELTGLYRSARRHYNEWIDTESTAYHRSHFGRVVSVRELFKAIDNPVRLAMDFADELSYRFLGSLDDDDAIQDFRHHIYKSARRSIQKIMSSSSETDQILVIDDRDRDPFMWEIVEKPGSICDAKTDLHMHLCPDFMTANDETKRAAIEMAAKIILFSI